uniref:Uncharacterized protein n=1 Tax=Leersia perrieri TaxID=77586 RepID=A0A0D9W625_9ORYZ
MMPPEARPAAALGRAGGDGNPTGVPLDLGSAQMRMKTMYTFTSSRSWADCPRKYTTMEIKMILQEAAQGVASMRPEEPEGLTKERPPKAALGSLGIQEQRQEMAQHQGQEQGKQDHQSSQHKLSSHHHSTSRLQAPPPPPAHLISQAWSLAATS